MTTVRKWRRFSGGAWPEGSPFPPPCHCGYDRGMSTERSQRPVLVWLVLAALIVACAVHKFGESAQAIPCIIAGLLAIGAVRWIVESRSFR